MYFGRLSPMGACRNFCKEGGGGQAQKKPSHHKEKKGTVERKEIHIERNTHHKESGGERLLLPHPLRAPISPSPAGTRAPSPVGTRAPTHAPVSPTSQGIPEYNSSCFMTWYKRNSCNHFSHIVPFVQCNIRTTYGNQGHFDQDFISYWVWYRNFLVHIGTVESQKIQNIKVQ